MLLLSQRVAPISPCFIYVTHVRRLISQPEFCVSDFRQLLAVGRPPFGKQLIVNHVQLVLTMGREKHVYDGWHKWSWPNFSVGALRVRQRTR
jgi:hypothetical protein